MLRAFHESTQAQMMIDGEMTDAFPVAHGVKQGCVLAPTPFTLFLAAVREVSNRDTTKGVYITTRSEGKRPLCVGNLLYADDTGFVSYSKVDFQTILDRLEFSRPLPRPDDYANDCRTNTTSSFNKMQGLPCYHPIMSSVQFRDIPAVWTSYSAIVTDTPTTLTSHPRKVVRPGDQQ